MACIASATATPLVSSRLGADLRVVQVLLGHASLNITQLYTAVTDQRKAAAVAALG